MLLTLTFNFNNDFETFTRHSGVYDEDQKILAFLMVVIWQILLEGAITFLVSFKNAFKKSFGNLSLYKQPGLENNLKITVEDWE